MKTYYIHPMAFGSTKNPGYGHVPVVKADEAEKLRAKLEAAEKRIAELEQQNSIANEKVTELSRLVQHNISRAEDAERRVESISKSSSLSHPGLLHATNELVLIFSHALADKLYAAQENINTEQAGVITTGGKPVSELSRNI